MNIKTIKENYTSVFVGLLLGLYSFLNCLGPIILSLLIKKSCCMDKHLEDSLAPSFGILRALWLLLHRVRQRSQGLLIITLANEEDFEVAILYIGSHPRENAIPEGDSATTTHMLYLKSCKALAEVLYF
jgi:predicted outer membrane lipoprotein